MGYQGAIFDVDGVLVDSPHELAWREALKELLEGDWRDIRDRTSWTAERFTTQVYQQLMAGKPRLAGARAALKYFGVPDVDRRAEQYADVKQRQLVSSSSKAGSGPFRMHRGSSSLSRTVGFAWRQHPRRKTPCCYSKDPTRHLHCRTAPRLWLRTQWDDPGRALRYRHLQPRLRPRQTRPHDLLDRCGGTRTFA